MVSNAGAVARAVAARSGEGLAPEVADARGAADEARVTGKRERERRGPGFGVSEIERARVAVRAFARRVNDDEAGAYQHVSQLRAAGRQRGGAGGEFGEQQFAREVLEHEELTQDGEARAAGRKAEERDHGRRANGRDHARKGGAQAIPEGVVGWRRSGGVHVRGEYAGVAAL
ncbi:MAG: hypothetical protein IPL62_10850 [Caulobacteraceae bacterium]|nr:hypothetical protein [Caulobacteraceae bacterium]